MSDKVYNTCFDQKITIIPSNYSSSICFKEDTGASKTYVRPTDKIILQERMNVLNGPKVQKPNKSNMKTVQSGILPLHKLLSNKAQTGNVLEGLNNAPLLSIGQLCDDNCITVFDKQYLHIFKNGTLVVRGIRNWIDGLWDVKIKNQEDKMNIIIRKDKTKTDLAEYLH